MVLGIQLVGAIFGLAIIIAAILFSKDRAFSQKDTGLWIVGGSLLLLISLAPSLLDALATRLDFVRTFDLLLVIGLFLLSVLALANYVALRRLNNKMSTTIQELAKKNR